MKASVTGLDTAANGDGEIMRTRGCKSEKQRDGVMARLISSLQSQSGHGHSGTADYPHTQSCRLDITARKRLP